MEVKAQFFRDGTSQHSRALRSQSPDYISVDERTLADHIRLAQTFAQQLTYFNEHHQPAGDWSAFFAGDADDIAAAVEAIAQANPVAETLSAELRSLLAQPHLALFLTSLKLLQHPQQQFRSLNQRRLDFYYRRVLQLAYKVATPDKAQVVFTLAPGETAQLIPAGTRLGAGTDGQGQDLHYATDSDLFMTAAQVAAVKSLSVEKETIDLEKIHRGDERTSDRTNAKFEAMLRWALGMPTQGDRLPSLLAEDGAETPMDIDQLNRMFETLRAAQQAATEAASLLAVARELGDQQFKRHYILERLCFATLEDFYACFDLHRRELASREPDSDVIRPTEPEWQQGYRMVERAFRKRVKRDRRLRLEQEHRDQKYTTATAAFVGLWQFALGVPDPGDALPPLTAERPADLAAVLADLASDDLALADAALGYVQNQLFLSRNDFETIMRGRRARPDNPNIAWPEIYRLLERAQTRKRGFTFPPIGRTEEKVIWTRAIAQTEQPPLVLPRFSPFNAAPSPQLAEADVTRGNALGVAIASPVLHLKTGDRHITLTLAYSADSFNRSQLETWLNRGEIPFNVRLSGEAGWLPISDKQLQESVQVGDFLIESEKLPKSYPVVEPTGGTRQKITLPATVPDTFDLTADVDTLLVWPDGRLYRITAIDSERSATVGLITTLAALPSVPVASAEANADAKIHHYAASGYYPNSLQFKLHLEATQPALVAPSPETSAASFETAYPVVKLTLKDPPRATRQGPVYYQVFKDFLLEKVSVQVAVENLEDVALRNDVAEINPKSPFEPFGSQPTTGTSLYFAHPELVSKSLDSLKLRLTWMGLPASFAEHYQAYHASGLTPPPPNIENNSFQVKAALFRDRTWTSLSANSLPSQPLFGNAANPLPAEQPLTFTKADFETLPKSMGSAPFDSPPVSDLLDQARYFRLELTGTDFQHTLYSPVLNKIVRDDSNTLTVYPPYTPKIKSVAVDYRASAEISLHSSRKGDGNIFQIHPFGHILLAEDHNTHLGQPQQFPFLPTYTHAGSLYVGLRDVQPEQQLSLLFQLVSGSGDADLPAPPVQWHYLTSLGWQVFEDDQLLVDSTNGLLDSGILRVVVPLAATDQNPLMPVGLHWLRATVDNNSRAIPDLLDIRTQAVTATFVDQGNAPEHLAQPLAARSITAFVAQQRAIATVEQPYSSFGGRPVEASSTFYTRVSERLRHKQRAVTRWDYERLVLENFPQIYKVKCLNQAERGPSHPGQGQVTVVVIPDLSNTIPFLPLEPKAPQHLLREIEAYLQSHTSPFVQVVAKNPRYEPIKYRVAVRLKAGVEEGYHLKQLNEELVRFLSPWAYEDQSDIAFGSSIHSSAVIHFIETRPYIDYVAKLKLIEQAVSADLTGATVKTGFEINDTNLAQVKAADSILVSAPEHFIDLISEDDYEEEAFEGIDYMIVGIDFVVS